jgi:hypothetical protein
LIHYFSQIPQLFIHIHRLLIVSEQLIDILVRVH